MTFWDWKSPMAGRWHGLHPSVAVQFAVDAVQIHGEDGVGARRRGVHISGTDLINRAELVRWLGGEVVRLNWLVSWLAS